MTLMELVASTAWLRPEEHIKVTLFDKDKYFENELDGYTDIKLNVYNLARYGNYNVKDICVNGDANDLWLECAVNV